LLSCYVASRDPKTVGGAAPYLCICKHSSSPRQIVARRRKVGRRQAWCHLSQMARRCVIEEINAQQTTPPPHPQAGRVPPADRQDPFLPWRSKALTLPGHPPGTGRGWWGGDRPPVWPTPLPLRKSLYAPGGRRSNLNLQWTGSGPPRGLRNRRARLAIAPPARPPYARQLSGLGFVAWRTGRSALQDILVSALLPYKRLQPAKKRERVVTIFLRQCGGMLTPCICKHSSRSRSESSDFSR